MSNHIPEGLVVVTGASSGIGASYAERLAAKGRPLLLVARREDRLSALQANLHERFGVPVDTLIADLEDSRDLEVLEARLSQGGIAMLVNNAGAGGLVPMKSATNEQLERIIRLNVLALTRLSRAALQSFQGSGAGVLVNIGSVAAFSPFAGGSAYSGSKAYVLNFTRSLQAEYAKTAIRVQLVMPGPIRTEFFSSQGLTDAVFPAESYVSAEALVDAALKGLEAGEDITTPTLAHEDIWEKLEEDRRAFMGDTFSGNIHERYLAHASA